MRRITLIKDGYEWELFQAEDGQLLVKDTEPQRGGFYSMFKNLEQAQFLGWELVEGEAQ